MTQAFGPITDASPIQFSAQLPDKVDVVIVGAGIIGISTALHLAKSKLKVLVCEKGRVAGEQSSRNWGWIRQQGRDPDELPIMMESRRIWQQWSEQYGDQLGFKVSGVLHLADTEQRAEKHQAWINTATEHGLDSTLLSREQLKQRVGDSAVWRSGLLTASDARAEPWQAVPHLAKACQEFGVTIIENCAVRTVESTNKVVTGVITEQGHVNAEQVLLCGGAWSSLFLKNLGTPLPQLTVKATVAQSAPCRAGVQHNISDSKIAFRKRLDGGYSIALTDTLTHLIGQDSLAHGRHYLSVIKEHWHEISPRCAPAVGYPGSFSGNDKWSGETVSPFESTRVLNPPADQRVLPLIKQRLLLRNKTLSDAPIRKLWAGMIDTMPDIVPVVDHAPNINGLWIATGMSGHGFGIGPGFGRIMADQLQGLDAGHEMQRFKYERFYDGSVLQPGPMI